MRKIIVVTLALLAFTLPAWATVNINAASQEELQTLKGVGPKKAQAIIEYRKKNGPFKTTSDLDKVPGFGAKTVDTLKKDISVGNATAAAAGKPEKEVKLASPVEKAGKK